MPDQPLPIPQKTEPADHLPGVGLLGFRRVTRKLADRSLVTAAFILPLGLLTVIETLYAADIIVSQELGIEGYWPFESFFLIPSLYVLATILLLSIVNLSLVIGSILKRPGLPGLRFITNKLAGGTSTSAALLITLGLATTVLTLWAASGIIRDELGIGGYWTIGSNLIVPLLYLLLFLFTLSLINFLLLLANRFSRRGLRLTIALALGVVFVILCVRWWVEETQNRNRSQVEAQVAWGRGNRELQSRHPEQAISEYDRAIGLWPGFVVAYVSRGNAHLALLAYDKAFADYDSAIKLDSNYPEAYFARGTVHWLLGDGGAAETDFRLLVGLRPDNEFYADRLALVLYEKHDKAGVEEFYRQLYSHNPTREWALKSWLYAILEAHGPEKLLVECESLRARVSSNTLAAFFGEAYYGIGKANKDRRDFLKAIDYLQQATAGDAKEVPLSLFKMLAASYLAIGDRSNCLTTMRNYAARQGRLDELSQAVCG